MSNEISSQNIYLLYRNKMRLFRHHKRGRRVASLTDGHKDTCYTTAYKHPEKAPLPTPP